MNDYVEVRAVDENSLNDKFKQIIDESIHPFSNTFDYSKPRVIQDIEKIESSEQPTEDIKDKYSFIGDSIQDIIKNGLSYSKKILSKEEANEPLDEPNPKKPFIITNGEAKPQVKTELTIPLKIKDYKQDEYDRFLKALNRVAQYDERAVKHYNFLVHLAAKESRFKPHIQNMYGAPYYGYFQIGKKYIEKEGYNLEDYRKDPESQINMALHMIDAYAGYLTKEDKRVAKEKGYNFYGLIGGAWLGGNGGLRTYINGNGNPSDKHWDEKSPEGKKNGTDVGSRVAYFNSF